MDFTFKSNPDYSHGFAMMFTADEPSFPYDFHPDFGYPMDFKGLGVFLHRSEAKKKWYVMAIQNNGLDRVARRGADLDKWIKEGKNSCEFDLNKDTVGGVRVKILLDYIYVLKKEANGDTSYNKCIVN